MTCGSAPVWISGGSSVAHPARSLPLQTFALTTITESSFWLVTYTLWFAGSTATHSVTSKPGAGKVTLPGVSVAQPARSAALQLRRSNAEIVLSLLAVYSVWLAGSTWAPMGARPASWSTPSRLQPDCAAALHVLASNTDTPVVPGGHPNSGWFAQMVT